MPPLPRSLAKVCVALGFESIHELGQAAEAEYRDGNTLIEVRLDHLRQPQRGVEWIKQFCASHADAQVLATCRHEAHHGHFRGTVDQQIKLLGEAADAGAFAVDLEVESAERARPALAKLRERAPVIVSYHNFDNTPSLEGVMRRLTRIEADGCKIATLARKPSDSLRLIEFLRVPRKTPLVAFAMSEQGFNTRVLSPGYGSLFTYACPASSAGTAAGQAPARVMKTLYHVDKLSRQSKVYGVIGDPVAHSKSPHIHNRAFQARRIDSVYLPFRVAQAQLGDWMRMAGKLPVWGFSVTIPNKQKIMRYLDHIEPLAKRIGAVNTVWKRAGRWRGTNTDMDGVVKPLSTHIRLAHAPVLLAGYGGAARAAAIALREAGAEVTITGRDLRRAALLAKTVAGKSVSLPAAMKEHFQVLVHATPVGMHPDCGACLFPDVVPADLVFDMVYNPHETELIKRAKAQGRQVIHGSEMFLEQAAAQFEIWTGEAAPRAVMRQALEHEL
jgi:3-dehydroquinate dehydratase / shikimate dehydrogenase